MLLVYSCGILEADYPYVFLYLCNSKSSALAYFILLDFQDNNTYLLWPFLCLDLLVLLLDGTH